MIDYNSNLYKGAREGP